MKISKLIIMIVLSLGGDLMACRMVCARGKELVVLCNPKPGRIYSVVVNSTDLISDMRCHFGKYGWLSYCETPEGSVRPATITTEYETIESLDPKDSEKTTEKQSLVFKVSFRNEVDTKLNRTWRFNRDSDDCTLDPKG